MDDVFAGMFDSATSTRKPGRPRKDATGSDSVGTSAADERKQSIYFKGNTLELLKAEAARLDRSLSWVVGQCVTIGLPALQAMASVDEVG